MGYVYLRSILYCVPREKLPPSAFSSGVNSFPPGGNVRVHLILYLMINTTQFIECLLQFPNTSRLSSITKQSKITIILNFMLSTMLDYITSSHEPHIIKPLALTYEEQTTHVLVRISTILLSFDIFKLNVVFLCCGLKMCNSITNY